MYVGIDVCLNHIFMMDLLMNFFLKKIVAVLVE